MLPANIQQITKTAGTLLSKNAPTILTGLAVAGLFSTIVLAIKGTPKAVDILTEARLDREDEVINKANEEGINDYVVEPFTKLEVVKLTWKCYIPTIAMAGLTVVCIVGSNKINLRRNAAIAGLYSLSDTAFKEYRAKVVETIGKNKERGVRDEIRKDHLTAKPVRDVDIIPTGYGEILCFDELSGRYFKSSMEQIKRVLNDISRDLLNDMHGFTPINEVYYGLGLPGIKVGDLLGWYLDDGLIEADFGTSLATNGEPCIVLDYTVEPKYYKRDY